MYLCDLEADSADKVREYIRQAQTHLNALIDMQGLRGRPKQRGGDQKAS
jgi:hypothetical protein